LFNSPLQRSTLPLQQPKHDFADVNVAVNDILRVHGLA
jgi:hypothetical protein